MASRYRVRTEPVAGTWHQYVSGSPTSNSNYSTDVLKEECWDEIGSPGDAHVLDVKRLDFRGFTPITGTSAHGAWAGSYYENGCSGNLTAVASSHLPITIPSNSEDTTKLLARTNPGRNYVSIPTLIQDIVDIPKMLNDWANILTSRKNGGTPLNLKTAANQHLGIMFGVMPLIKDIKDLSEMQGAVLKRKQELMRLYSVGGLRRRLRLGTYQAEQTTKNHLVTSYPGGYVQGTIQKTTTIQRWGTVRWLPSQIPKYHPGEVELYHQAQKIMAGLTVESFLEGAWDVIPWTWVLDWFADFGEFSQAHSMTVPAYSYRPCIMTHTRTQTYFTPTFVSPGIQPCTGHIIYESKQRVHDVIPTPATAVLPLMDLRKLSILGSLAVQKLK